MNDLAAGGNGLTMEWSQSRLGEIAEINPALDMSQLSRDLPVSFVPMPAVEALTGQIDTSDVRSLSEVSKGYTRFTEGDVLFAKITPCMENGKIAIAKSLSNGLGFGSTEFHVVRSLDGISNRYIFYYLLQDAFREEAEHNMKGTAGQRRVPADFLEDARIPIPPSREQERIVAKIDELFSELDAGVASLKRARALLKKYRRSVLKAAVTGELTRDWRERHKGEIKESGAELLQRILKARRQAWEATELNKLRAKGRPPKDDRWKQKYKEPQPPDTSHLPALPEGWVWATVDSIAALVTDGDHNPPKRVERGIPHLTAKNVKQWKLDTTGCTFVSNAGYEQTRARYEPKAGDIIITCVGTIGETAIVPSNFLFSADRNLAAIRVVQSPVFTQYLHFVLHAPELQQQLRQASGSTAQPHLYLRDIKNLIVPIPPMSEQSAIVEKIDEKLSNCARLQEDLGSASSVLRSLRQSILKAAFSGKLVPQHPSDEPASVLLERIRAERAAKSRPARGRRQMKTSTDRQLELLS